MNVNYPIYNCHIHTFNHKAVPDEFFPEWLLELAKTKPVKNLLSDMANDRRPALEIFEALVNILAKAAKVWGDEEELEDYVQFLVYSNMKTQRKIFESCIKGYPDDSKFIVLPMDMAYMNRGEVSQKYDKQLEELSKIATSFPDRVIPFVHVDPRRPGFELIMRNAVEKLGFKGIKLYPPLGVYPFDKRLKVVYDYCKEKSLPVMTHCSPHNPVRFKVHKKILHPVQHKRDMDDLRALAENNPFSDVNTKGLDHKELCDLFTHPKNYATVCEKHPMVKICLAHFGSTREWKKYKKDKTDPENWVNIIRNMVKKYRYLYTDISYLMYFKEYHKLLKDMLDNDEGLRRKVLFGSDFYMPMNRDKDLNYVDALKKGIGDENFKVIAHDNPKTYLGIR